LRRAKLNVVHHNIRQVVGHADNPLGISLVAGKELQEILQLAWVLLFQETLSTASLAGVPTESRAAATVIRLLAIDKRIPSLVNKGLMKQAVDHTRVHPLSLCHTRLEMPSHMLNVSLPGRVKGRAKATSPVLALAEKPNNLLGVRTGCASVALLVVLVERIGSPKAAVAAGLGAGVLPPTLVKFVLVALPIVLAFEARLARCAPVNVLLVSW
jgi:hypothetical protein